MRRFYRYLIYKLYSWRIDKKDGTPIATTIIILTFVHYVQLFIIYLFLLKLFPEINIFSIVDKKYVGLFLIIFGVIHYFLVYDKVRWGQYVEEFGSESGAEKRKGSIIVTAYLLGTVLLFFILMPVLFGF
jgi:hypothetical protein